MQSIAELKNASFRCYEMSVREKSFFISQFKPEHYFKRVYCTRNGLLAFYDDDEELFVTRWNFRKEHVLINAGYKKERFHVPFSDGERPIARLVAKELEEYIS